MTQINIASDEVMVGAVGPETEAKMSFAELQPMKIFDMVILPLTPSFAVPIGQPNKRDKAEHFSRKLLYVIIKCPPTAVRLANPLILFKAEFV